MIASANHEDLFPVSNKTYICRIKDAHDETARVLKFAIVRKIVGTKNAPKIFGFPVVPPIRPSNKDADEIFVITIAAAELIAPDKTKNFSKFIFGNFAAITMQDKIAAKPKCLLSDPQNARY